LNIVESINGAKKGLLHCQLLKESQSRNFKMWLYKKRICGCKK